MVRDAKGSSTNLDLISPVREYRDFSVGDLPDRLPPPRGLETTIVSLRDATLAEKKHPTLQRPCVPSQNMD